MSQKQVNSPVKYLVILTLLVGIFLVRANWERIRPPENPLTSYLGNLIQEQVTALTIEKAGTRLEFTKNGESWELQKRKVDESLIGPLLAILTAPDSAETVATAPDRFGEFELTDEAAYKVTANGKSLFLGKTSVGGIYARLEGENDTILLSGTPPQLTPEPEDWLDTRIYSFDSDTLTKIRIVSAGKTSGFLKKEDKWQSETTGAEVPKESIDKIIHTVNTIYGNKALLNESKPEGYGVSAELTVTVEAGEGKSETVEFFKGSDNYLAKRASDGAFFEAASYTVTGIQDNIK